MGIIRASSATVTSLYLTFLAFVILCIINFIPTNLNEGQLDVITNFNNGIVFLILSICGLLVGFTSGDVDDPFLRAFLLCLSSMWGALGTFYLTKDIPGPSTFLLGFSPPQFSVPEALFPGYGAFFFIFLIFAFACIQHHNLFTASLSLGLFLCCIFEIAALWRPVRLSIGAYYLLLATMVIYMVAKMLVDKLRGIDLQKAAKRLPTDTDQSNDYMAVGYAMDVVAFAVFASHVTGATTIANNGFMWVGSAGIFQIVCGVVAIRRKDPYCGSFFTLYGVFWTAVAINLGLDHFSFFYNLPLLSVNIFFVVVFILVSVVSLTRELFHSLQNILLAVFTIAICVDGTRGRFLGGMGWVCFLFSLYGLAAHAGRLRPTRFKLPLGRRLFDRAQIRQCLVTRLACCAKCVYGDRQTDTPARSEDRLFSTDFSDMGYSKYIDLDTIGFAVNAISSLSVLWIPANLTLLTLPWVSIVGGASQMIVGCICFARGLTFESCSFIVFSTMWLILGTARSVGALSQDNSISMGIGSITYMIIGLLLIGLSLVISKAWFLVTFLFELVALAFLLNTLAVASYDAYEIIVVLLFTLVCLYCFLASAFKAIWGRELLPTGSPIIQVSYLHSEGNRAFWAHAQKQSGVKAIAEIMNRGGIAGIPTDTVYVLAAPVKFPQAVERAYLTKKLAEDRPMSMWISNVNQLSAGREEFGEILWDFMNAVWPSTISCVVSKGPWLDSLHIGSASKYVGRPDSIAVRMPDNMVTSFLIDHTGPVATTSANPTGEADTTHHLQVLAKLGLKNCDGILCDGPSFANSASTVVDCRKIDEGKIGFFRIGLVPKSRVEEIFERIQAKHQKGGKAIPRNLSTHSISETLDSGVCDRDPEYGEGGGGDGAGRGGHINPAFEDDHHGNIRSDPLADSFGQLKESDVHPYVSSSQISRNLIGSIDGGGRGDLIKSPVLSVDRQPEQNVGVDLKAKDSGILDPDRLDHLIKNLENLLQESTGNAISPSAKAEVVKLIGKLERNKHIELQPNLIDILGDTGHDDNDYEKMNFNNGESDKTKTLDKTLNEIVSVMDSPDGSDEPLTSLKSRKRRELQEEINKYVLSRGNKINANQTNNNELKNIPNEIFKTTLEINVNRDQSSKLDDQFPGLTYEGNDGTPDRQTISSTPLLENIIRFQEENDKGDPLRRKVIHPPPNILENNIAIINVENGEKTSENEAAKSLGNQPLNSTGYSLKFTDKFGKEVPGRQEEPKWSPPVVERVAAHTQRTQL